MNQQEPLFLHNSDIIVDNFAGGGGASTGIEAALGIPVDIAVNHDGEAVAMHAVNHPHTKHYCEDVWTVDPMEVTQGRPVRLAWFSPDCKHFSKAKGGKPVSKKIRGLAWIVVKWAKLVQPAVIMLENVEEFETWGPLLESGLPCPVRKGFTFRRWWKQLENLGYQIEMRVLRACDYGAPTIRKRLFIIARRDRLPIIWPAPTHNKGGTDGLKAWRTAAECIDFSIPCPSIFERRKPLADNTLRRIARGLQRYVIDAADPFIVNLTHHGNDGVEGLDEPFKTVTGANRGEKALVTPYVARIGQTGFNGRFGAGVDEPLSTVTSKAEHLLVTPFLATYYGSKRPGGDRTAPADGPLRTQSTENRFALVAPTLVNVANGKTTGRGPNTWPVSEPARTVTASGGLAVVAATLVDVAHGDVSPGGVKRRGKGHHDVRIPLGTIAASGNQALVSAFLAQHNTERVGHNPGRAASEPISTITGRGTQQQLVTSHLLKLKGTSKDGQRVDAPLHTITSGGLHHAEVRAFLEQYIDEKECGNSDAQARAVACGDRLGIVNIHGVDYVIVDIGMRMLTPRELYNAQGFSADYLIDFSVGGKPMTKTAQVRMCGNSVCPPLAEALVRANLAAVAADRHFAAAE